MRSNNLTRRRGASLPPVARVLVGRLVRLVPPLLLLAACVLLWQRWVDVQHVPDYVLPGPREIWRTTLDEHQTLLSSAIPTAQTAILGFVLAVVAGLAIAVLIHLSYIAELTLYPIVIASQAVPVLALAPLLVILFGFSLLPNLIVVALICFFPITVNAVDGLKSADPDMLDLLRSLGAHRLQRFALVEWPAALPLIFSGARVAATFSVVGALYGEIVGSAGGLAAVINQAQSRFDTGLLFSAMMVLTVLGLTLFGVLTVLERLLLPWRRAGTAAPPPATSRKGPFL